MYTIKLTQLARMKTLLTLLITMILISCTRYKDKEEVIIKLNDCKGTVISVNEIEMIYKIRYVDKNGVYHTESFEENEIKPIYKVIKNYETDSL